MKTNHEIQSQIIKLRRLLKLDCINEREKDLLWHSMLCLQWSLGNPKETSIITPVSICVPQYKLKVRLK